MARIPEILATAAILFAPGCAPKAETPSITRESIAQATTHPLLATPDPVRQLAPTVSPTPELAKKPENILPEYAVYYGQMKQENGSGTGSVIIANIPGYPNQLYAFFIANRSGQGSLYEINSTDGNSLAAGTKFTRIHITSGDTAALSGRFERLNTTPPTSWVFEIKKYGTGKDATFEAAKKLWAKEVANDPTLWQKVPDATILLAGFRGIELP